MSQDSQKPQESAPVFLLLFVGFIIGLCVGFMTKDYVVRAMIGVMPKTATQTDLPPIDPNETALTPELPTTPPGQDVAPTTPTPEGEGTTEEKKAEEEKEVTPEGTAPATPAEPAPAADAPPATPAPAAE